MKAVADNDIILKGACYGILEEIIIPTCGSADPVGVLGAARFVVRRRVTRMTLNGDNVAVLGRLESFFTSALTLEPTDQEAALAAELELTAQRLRMGLDSGESLLCAVVTTRAVPLLLTGDKRAICAMEALLNADCQLAALSNAVKCLEQLVHAALSAGQGSLLKAAICAEPTVDKALSICFSCSTGRGDDRSFAQGLESYIASLRSAAQHVLAT